MKHLLLLILLPALALAGCAAPSESGGETNGTADCPDNSTAGGGNATAAVDEGGMETDECAEPAPASSNMCVEGAEDCEDTVNSTEG